MMKLPDFILSCTASQHRELHEHLFPQEGHEAVAIVFCGQRPGEDRHKLLAREIHLVPFEQCSEKSPLRIKWSTGMLPPLLERAEKKGWAVVKIHSHPNRFPTFSELDDAADKDLFPSIHGWIDGNTPHASLIMFPDGRMIGRHVDSVGNFHPLHAIHVVGDDLSLWFSDNACSIPEFGKRVAQTFGEGTLNKLRKLKVAVVGCSGTGSLVIEQLARNCIGALVLIDPDFVEEKNLNRIPNTTMQDAAEKRAKVNVLANAIANMGLGTNVHAIHGDLYDPSTILAIAGCDVVFGCMDTIEGRHILNRLASFYLLPYFDLGVKLVADTKGNVDEVSGAVHYLQPGGSSLRSRRVYTDERLRAESLFRTDPDSYHARRKEGYIQNVHEEKPAVISVNMLVAAMAVNDFLARINPFRADPNADYAIQRFSLVNGLMYNESDGEPCDALSRHIGRGDVTPLLDMPMFDCGGKP